jgi:hypothetical protein
MLTMLRCCNLILPEAKSLFLPEVPNLLKLAYRRTRSSRKMASNESNACFDPKACGTLGAFESPLRYHAIGQGRPTRPSTPPRPAIAASRR